MSIGNEKIISMVYETIGRGLESGGTNISCDVVDISPEMAKTMLDFSAEAEKRKKVHITGTVDKKQADVRADRLQRQYAADMKNGEWELSGEAIIITVEGIIISGTVRLRACIEANTRFTVFVVRNVPFEAVYSVNDRLLRTESDTQYCALVSSNQISDGKEDRNEANRSFYSRMIKSILRCPDGAWTAERSSFSKSQIGLTASIYFHDMKSICDEFDSIIKDHAYERRENSHSFTAPAQRALLFLLSKCNKRAAFDFVLGIVFQNAPKSYIFDRFMKNIIKKTKGRRDESGTFGRMICAWNDFMLSGDVDGGVSKKLPARVELFGWPKDFKVEVKSHTRAVSTENATKMEYKYAVITITPEMATEVLNNLNGINRVKRKTHYSKLAKIITDGQWVVNGQSIKFGKSSDGDIVLLDGQHRLEAIEMSKISVESLVIVGLDAGLFPYLDMEDHERGLRAVLKKTGISKSETIATATKVIYETINGAGKSKGISLRDLTDFCMNMQMPRRKDEISAFLQANTSGKRSKSIFSASLVLAFYGIAYHDEDFGRIPHKITCPLKNYIMIVQGINNINDDVLGGISVNSDVDWFGSSKKPVNCSKLPWSQMPAAMELLRQSSRIAGGKTRESNTIKSLRLFLDVWMLYKTGKVLNSAKILSETNGRIYYSSLAEQESKNAGKCDLPDFVIEQSKGANDNCD